MESYNFKSIPNIQTTQEFIDTVLSKTQRKTPTIIHKGYEIKRIRDFYINKVKFTQQSVHDKLSKIVESFPKIENIHPFYADLINVLYDKDHYKIALGRVNLSKSLVDRVAREYIRFIKYGDSLYRCKTLKTIALGRMVTIIKKMQKTFVYLEQVRQHLSRLPTIDPSTRTLILCGFPNVGKSSFMNKVTRAEVEVQPYPFTTKSLYVGQMDYKYLRFQVIDTPGILDHPLEERNTIEMQAITAMAHLRATIIFMMDISELCGHSIEEQIKLFHHLSPLFTDKSVIIGLNKTDVVSPDDLPLELKNLLSKLEDGGAILCPLSTLHETGVMELRDRACELLLLQREQKTNNSKLPQSLQNRLHVAIPKSRDNIERKPFVPESLIIDIANNQPLEKPVSHKRLKLELGEDYHFDEKEYYLINENEKFDIIPEIMDGKNISDFVDRNIVENLKRIEEEERLRQESGYYDINKWSYEEIQSHYDRKGIADKRKVIMAKHSLNKSSNRPRLPKSVVNKNNEFISRGKPKAFTLKSNSLSYIPDLEEDNKSTLSSGTAESSLQLTALSNVARYENKLAKSGINDVMKAKVRKLIHQSQQKRNLLGRVGEADRHIFDLKPKHLFSGKRKAGKTQRR